MYAYLDRPVRSLAEPDQFLLSAMRGFAAAAQGRNCVCSALAGGFEARDVAEALPDFVNAMALINRDGLQRMRFAPVVWPKVTDDEARVLALFALGRSGDDTLQTAASALVGDEAVAPLLVAVDTISVAMAGGAA